MTALADQPAVEAALGRTLTSGEVDRVEPLLLLASSFVEARTGFRFAPGEYTVGRKVRRGRVSLLARVDSVDEVREVDERSGEVTTLTVVADYTTRGRTVYGLGSRCFVEVDFTVTEAVPDEIVALVAGLVASVVEAPAANVESETAGPFQVSYMTSSGRVYLAESDKAVLKRYTQPRPAIDTLG